jgi:DNA ligase-1
MKCVYKKTLYKIDSKDKIRTYNVKVTQLSDEMSAKIITTTGLLTGKKVVKETIVSKGKNLGKSNATTPFQQAEADADSSLRKKKDGGYLSLNDLGIKSTKDGYESGGIVFPESSLAITIQRIFPKGECILPMKYGKYRLETYPKGSKQYKESKPLNFPVFVSPKLDGVNCWGNAKNGLTTRGGKTELTKGGDTWNNICPQIANALAILNYPYPLNGEVYKHGHTLQDITDACKKKRPLSTLLEFHIFDICVSDRTFRQRRSDMELLFNIINQKGLAGVIKIVPSKNVYNTEELLKYEETHLELGYEGIMVKAQSNLYKTDYRSRDALKLVRFDSMEVEIKDIIPYEKEPDLGKFICLYKGREFFVDPGIGFDKTLKREILKNKSKYIGQLLTISHRGFTSHDFPRIAKGEGGAKAFRPKNDL